MIRKRVSVKELRNRFNKLNKEYFNGMLPIVELVWSTRMTRCAGNCTCYRGERPTRIALSTHYHSKFPQEINSTLIHEMIHASGVRGHGKDFYAEMNRINKKAGKEVVARHSLESAKEPQWAISCESCSMKCKRHRKPTPGSVCARCGGQLRMVNTDKKRLCSAMDFK